MSVNLCKLIRISAVLLSLRFYLIFLLSWHDCAWAEESGGVELALLSGKGSFELTAGETTRVSVLVIHSPWTLTGFQLNFSAIAPGLAASNWSQDPIWPFTLDNNLNTPDDALVSAATIGAGLSAPLALGSFDLTAPQFNGIYRLTLDDRSGGAFRTDFISDSLDVGEVMQIHSYGEVDVVVAGGVDLDSDNDGVPDKDDCAPEDSAAWREQAYLDADQDGIRDSSDLQVVQCFGEVAPPGSTLEENGPDNCLGIYNPDQSDIDQDGTGDLCDDDIDGDQIPNDEDCAPYDPDLWRNQAYPDSDQDGVRDSLEQANVECFGVEVPLGHTLNENGPDNCPVIFNPDQSDMDQDGTGDLCDDDIDGDQIPNDEDCAPYDPDLWRNQAYPDSDQDGVRDSLEQAKVECFGLEVPLGHTLNENGPDNCPVIFNPDQSDSNGNGIGDACDHWKPNNFELTIGKKRSLREGGNYVIRGRLLTDNRPVVNAVVELLFKPFRRSYKSASTRVIFRVRARKATNMNGMYVFRVKRSGRYRTQFNQVRSRMIRVTIMP